MPIQAIWGNDKYSCDKEIEKIISNHISPEWKDFNLNKFNGDDPNEIIKAFDASLTPPFGEGSRVVLLKNNPIFNKKDEIMTKKLESISTNLPAGNHLILQSNQKPDARIKTTKLIRQLIRDNKAKEKFYNLPNIWDYESQQEFTEKISNNLNIKLEKNVSSTLLETVGTDSLKLKNELEKALLYIEAKSDTTDKDIVLTNEIAKELFNDHQTNIFKIIDLLLQKKIPQSLHDICKLLNQGEPPLKLIAGLTSQVRIHTIVLLLSDSVDSSKLLEITEISNPKRIYFIRKKTSKCSSSYLINLMIMLLNIEISLKKGNNPISTFTENFVTLT